MVLFYFLSAFILSMGALFIKKQSITKILVGIFLLIQIVFTIYVFQNSGKTELTFFTFDALGTIFLSVYDACQHCSCLSRFHVFQGS